MRAIEGGARFNMHTSGSLIATLSPLNTVFTKRVGPVERRFPDRPDELGGSVTFPSWNILPSARKS